MCACVYVCVCVTVSESLCVCACVLVCLCVLCVHVRELRKEGESCMSNCASASEVDDSEWLQRFCAND